MPALQVKDCPADVYDSLKRCAARENRSISQQALTILEEHLGFRGIARNERSQSTRSDAQKKQERIERRKRLFESLDELPVIPISEDSPSSVDILAEIRETEAR